MFRIIPLGFITVLMLSAGMFGCTSDSQTSAFSWDGIRPEIRDTIEQFAHHSTIVDYLVGAAAETPRQWHQQQWLYKNATSAELERLTKHPDGHIKGLAYQFQIQRGKKSIVQVVETAFRDTSVYLNYVQSCEGYAFLIGEYLVDQVLFLEPDNPLPPGLENLYGLSGEEIHQIMKVYDDQMANKDECLKRIREENEDWSD